MVRPIHAVLPLLIAAVLPFSNAGAQTVAPRDLPYPGALQLDVDATDLARRVLHVRQRIPVQPGALTLLFPQWIQGNHSPTGPIDKLAGLRLRGNGQTIAWQRDPLDVYAFKLVVPEGVSELEASFDMLTPTGGNQGRVVMTADMLNVQWNQVALYPAGYYARGIQIVPSLKLPAGWQAGTALELDSRQGDSLRYRAMPFDTLLDSPVFAGRHFKQIDLAADAKTPVRLNVVADAAKYLEAKPEQIKLHRELVSQAFKLFGSRPFDRYDFLFSLSGQMSGIGLEHHRSSENGLDVDYFTGWDGGSAINRDLLAHEFAHSWNGKYRRPGGIAAPNFNVPLSDSLLWVYEGQTQYWGYVLTARSGLWKPELAREALAQVAARYSHDRPGLAWRALQDTTYDPVIAQRRPKSYTSYQLSEDYYQGGQLVWLAVDAKLRALSGDKRSLDDFARVFFAGENGDYRVKPYEFEDVVAALNGVAAFDWAAFLRERIDGNAPPVDGLAASGWKLVFTDTPGEFQKLAEGERKAVDLTYSLGMSVSNGDSSVNSVRWDGPAFDAGIAPGNTVLAVNGYASSGERLKDAITAAKDGQHPIELLIKNGDAIKAVRIDYREGLKYPKLERIEGTPDRLSKIYAPK
ncbi:M61 family metallopeptidase [Lysobacter antibioticus]|uniref:M61 glycyl aminopeptidase family protein n=1 Tax=Lysobacter antibioticus TaxID=84531 RepID=A0A0S2FHK1_LYSAN|nr:M61 family metallopeptidase [Lysobacter antibioticus]ALN82990.1 M61 glycyl aminopeptidase family protein [Lysobacter antibioticus]